jgi:epoxyqueuosine reductase
LPPSALEGDDWYTRKKMTAIDKSKASERARRTDAIKQKAHELGFDKVGIAAAQTLEDEGEQLKEWLRRGFHAEMAYMARDPERRTNPTQIFPEARAVVAVALNYYTPHQHAVSTTSANGTNARTGKVSRYAWGDDYHDVVAEKLRDLLVWIKSQWPETEGKVCVDIQSTMDKAWAVRAGLGWLGKHTNVITRDFGSWVFIGELFLNLELEYETEQIADQCGSCTLCIDACPTHAIAEPYVVDANLCISHATIESREPEIRADVASHLEGWLYGCDICQDVCPWNHTPSETTEPRFQPRAHSVNVPLAEIFEINPENYAARFRRSAIKRAKIDGLKRNARALEQQSKRH